LKILCRVPLCVALGKEIFLKKLFVECPCAWHSAKR
jgi:hypothetical protein